MSETKELTALLTRRVPDPMKVSLYAQSRNLDFDELIEICLKFNTMRWELGPGLNPLHVACIRSSPAVVAALIREGYDVNSGPRNVDSYLRIALDSGNIPVAQMLLKVGVDPNAKNSNGKTPIDAALSGTKVEQLCISALRLLVQEASVSVDAVAIHGNQERALHIAARNNLPLVVEFLFERGADGNVTDSLGCTPLHYACYRNHVECVNLLVSRKVDMYAHNSGNDTPLSIVVREDHRDALKALLKGGCDINKLLIDGCFSVLHCAIDESNLDKVKYLVSLGADPNLRLSNGKRPLHILALREKSQNVKEETSKVQSGLDILEFLVEKGATINAMDTSKNTPLQLAIFKKCLKLAKLLIQLGANMNLYLSGITLFHSVACINHEIITIFIEFGADYNKKDKAGLTPYHTAINSHVNLKYIKSFLLYGCPFNQGHSDWYGSKVCGSTEFLKFYTAEDQFFKGIKENKIAMVKEAVKGGAMPTGTSEKFRYPLHYVTSKGYTELVQYLLENAVPANRLNDAGESALFIAARQGNVVICSILLQFGACYNYPNKKCSRTPKMIAQEKGHKSVVNLLLAVDVMFSLAKRGSKNLLKTLLNAINSYDEYQTYANAINNKGCTLLSTCLNMNHYKNAAELMEFRNLASLEKFKQP